MQSRSILTALAFCSLVFPSESFAEVEVVAPGGDTAKVARLLGDRASSVEYVVVRDTASSVKFEDAPVGLGEDDASHRDTSSDGSKVYTVTIEATVEVDYALSHVAFEFAQGERSLAACD